MSRNYNYWGRENSKGVSPLISIVLLIGMTIVLSAIVYQFSFNYTKGTIETTEKQIESAKPINFNIKEVKNIDYKKLLVLVESLDKNRIESFKARIYGSKNTQTYTLNGVQPFETAQFIFNYSYLDLGEISKIELVPITKEADTVLVHPISIDSTIKIENEISDQCKYDANANDIPDCVDDLDNDNCEDSLDYSNETCIKNSCTIDSTRGCDSICKPIECIGSEICLEGACKDKLTIANDCTLDEAYWSENVISAGDTVNIIVKGRNCNGLTLNLIYSEVDTITPDDDINNSEFDLPTNVTFDNNGTAIVTWQVKWRVDNDGNNPNPELLFNASVNPSIISNNSLTIYPDQGAMGMGGAPIVTLVKPEDRIVLPSGLVKFECQISDLVNINNVSLYSNLSSVFKQEKILNPHEFEPDNQTIALYHFNNESFYQELTTKFVDFSLYRNNGSCSGIPQGCPGRNPSLFSTGAVNFDQAGPPGDGIVIQDQPHLGNMNNLSMSVWVYPRSAGSGGIASIVNKPNAFVLRMDGAGPQINIRTYNSLAQSVQVYSQTGGYNNGIVALNQWTHVVAIYNGTSIKTYINGIETNRVAFSGSIRDSVDNVYVGNNNLYSLTFDGLIDELILFNSSLSDNEVQDLYQRKNAITTYSLNKSLLGFNEGYYQWNCQANSDGGSAWHVSNYSFSIDGTSPSIMWEYPTPINNSVVIADSIYLNASIIDESNTSAFFDWNNTLIGYWSMDFYNESGIYDNSTYDNFARFMGTISTNSISNGKFGRAFTFGGFNDYLKVDDSNEFEGMNELTIAAWVNPTSGQNDQRIVFKSNTYVLRLNGATPKIYFMIYNDASSAEMNTANTIPLDTWTHVVATYDGFTMKVYINGVEDQNTNTISGPVRNIASPAIAIGNNHAGGSSFNGSIDEVVMLRRTLSSDEIRAVYNNGINRLFNKFENLVEGQYNYSAYAIDEAGNLNISKRIVSVLRIPIVNLSRPMNEAIISQPSIPLEFQCNAASYNYLENISLYTDITGEWNLTKSTIINQFDMEKGIIFLSHFNNNNLSEESEFPLYESGTSYEEGLYRDGIRIDAGDNLYYNSSNNFNISFGTIEFWIKPNWFGNDNQQYIFFFSMADNGDHIKIGKTFNVWNYIHATFNNSAYEANDYAYGGGSEGIGNWGPGSWHHIAVTYNLSEHSIHLYIDGNERGYANESTCYPPSCSWGSIPKITGANLSIGHNYIFSPKYANAVMDELIIYGRVLNLTEIQLDMNRTKPVLSYNATFKVADILSGGPYKWNCQVYDNYNRSAWNSENWTFSYTAIPFIELLTPTNNSILNEGRINFTCVAQDYDNLENVSLQVYNIYNGQTINLTKNSGEIPNNDSNLQLLLHLDNDPYFDENMTFVYDASGHNNNGIVSGATYVNNSKINGGFMFDTPDDFIELNGSEDLRMIDSEFSIEAWINVSQAKDGLVVGEFGPVCGGGNEVYGIYTSETGYFGFSLHNGTTLKSIYSYNPFRLHDWYHVVGVYNRTQMKIYVNGILNRTTDSSGLLNPIGYKFNIGKWIQCNIYDFKGVVDEVAVYNKALSDEEISRYYNLGKRKFYAYFATNIPGDRYEWNCNAYDSEGNSNYAPYNNTLIVNSNPNLTSVFIGNDGVMYNCEDGCYVTPYRHSNSTNLSIRVSLIDNSCSLITHKVYAHLCLINTTNNEICNEITSNYTYELNNLTTKVYESSQNKYLCNFSTTNELGPEGTPAFFVGPGNYKLFINVTEIITGINNSLSDNYWIYRSLMDTGFVDSTGEEVTTIQLGDGDIQLGEFNPGINEYKLQNWGNIILGLTWNATNPNSTISEWDINYPSDGFILDDDINPSYPDSGLKPLNITSIARSFIFNNGLMRCISQECNDSVNETLHTRWHIKPPFGLPPGIYKNEITYLISQWKSEPKQIIAYDQPAYDTSLTALDNRTFIVSWVDSLDLKISFIIYDTNGTNLTSIIDVDQTVDKMSRVSVAVRNSTHFVIAWYDGFEQDVTFSIYNRTGQINYGPIDLETTVGGSFSDISLAQMTDRFHNCYVDVEESDLDNRIVTYNSLGTGIEFTIDSLITPEDSLQNLIGCSAINNTRLAYIWFDDSENDVTYAITTESGSFISLPTDLDTDVFEFGQVAITSFNSSSPNFSRFAISWFDSSTGEIKLVVKDVNNNNILLPSVISYSTTTRISMTSYIDSASNSEGFILAWQDKLTDDIKAAVFDEDGAIKFGPYILVEDEHPSNLLFEIYGRDTNRNIGLCKDSFILAYASSTGQTLIKEYKVDGNGWDGKC